MVTLSVQCQEIHVRVQHIVQHPDIGQSSVVIICQFSYTLESLDLCDMKLTTHAQLEQPCQHQTH